MMRTSKKVNLIKVVSLVAVVVMSSISFAHTAPQETDKRRTEHIQATAQGTSTQLGRMVSVDISIEEYSTPEDQKILLNAFNSAGQKGLINALDKMKAKGRIGITGTLGYDVNYIREFPTADGGRKIRMVTDRPVRFGEAWSSGRSMDYSLSALEIELNNTTNGKSAGTLLPACKFKIGKDRHLEIEALQNPWKLVNIMQR